MADFAVFDHCSGAEKDDLLELLGETYKPEGVELWLAHADRQGWSYEECLSRAIGMVEGSFS